MNFQELISKLHELDQSVTEEPNEGNAFSGALDAAKASGKDEFEVDGKKYKVKEDGSVEECGMDMMPSKMPGQQDSVNMNVSLNASGSGGIKDLMDILRNIEQGKGDDHDHGMDMPMAIAMDNLSSEEFANEPDEMYSDIDSVTGTGGDLHSKGIEAPAANGGGNPMPLKARLESLYNEIKQR